jgi:excisionase family DNA binding protein
MLAMPVGRRRTSMRKLPLTTNRRNAIPTDAVFTIDDLVIYLKLPKSTVYKLAQEGQIPGHKVGRHWRFHRVTIDQWLRNDSTTRDSKEKS